MRRLLVVVGLLFTMVGAPTIAQAFDIPLLTWERGREQQVVLGGGAYTQDWNVTLEGNGAEPLTFAASEKNAAGYVVYSVDVPADYPLGSYSIFTAGKGSSRTLVAGIEIIAAQTRTVIYNLFDLSKILAIFALLTAVVSTIRSRKYQFIPFKSEQVLPKLTDPILDGDDNFWDRLEKAPYRIRVQFLISLRQSLLRFLLIREGEVAHRISKPFYGLSPFIGLIAGAIAAIEVSRNHGIATTPMSIFLGIAALAIFDAMAGVTATLGFWAAQLLTGNMTSFRDVLIALSIGIAWVGPSLFAALLRETIDRDFKHREIAGQDPIKFLGIIGSSAIGGLVFYFGHALVNSVIYTETQVRSLNVVQVTIVSVMLVIRGFADGIVLHDHRPEREHDESFVIARTNSPMTAFLIIAIIFAFVYIWTSSAGKSLFVAVVFGLPFILSFIRINPIKAVTIEKLPRFILIESAIVAAVVFIVFRQVSMKPLLIDQKANLVLLLAALSPVVHALYSLLHASNEAKFSFQENKEIIQP